MIEIDVDEAMQPLKELEPLGKVPVAPAHGIAAIALSIEKRSLPSGMKVGASLTYLRSKHLPKGHHHA